jgi:hypothetical protein
MPLRINNGGAMALDTAPLHSVEVPYPHESLQHESTAAVEAALPVHAGCGTEL